MATTTTPTRGARSATPTTDVQVLPATIDRWPDVVTMLGGDLDKGCWCQAWRGRDEVAKAAGESRPETLRRQVQEAAPPPGYLAYIGNDVVGWCGVSVRGRTPRLDGSRTIPKLDDKPVWAIGCFLIRVGYRRRGVATALLAGVVNAAREAGAPGVEAYQWWQEPAWPADSAVRKLLPQPQPETAFGLLTVKPAPISVSR